VKKLQKGGTQFEPPVLLTTKQRRKERKPGCGEGEIAFLGSPAKKRPVG